MRVRAFGMIPPFRLLYFGLVLALSPLSAAAARPLNILLLIDDQHRGDWLGAAGAHWMITPHLDRLAREGALFRRAYTSTPSCLPARAALLTGMSPWGHGCLGYVKIPESYPAEKPRLFTQAGWRTHVVGKNHFDPPSNLHGYESGALGDSNAPGVNYWQWFLSQAPGRRPNQGSRSSNDQRGGLIYPFGEELHRTTWTANHALEFLANYREARPWLLKVSFLHPHPPFNPLARWLRRYENVDLPLQVVSEWSRKEWGEVRGSLHDNPDTQRGVIPEEEMRAMRRSYAAAISQVDEQIGLILAAVEKRGEWENTLILFTSDHGDMMGDHLLYRKTYPYEGSVHVPLILRWPSSLGLTAARGQLRNELTELRDVLPTLLDAAGLPRPATVEGLSLLDLLRGHPGRALLDLEHASCYQPQDGWVALMDQRYKYVYFLHTGRQQLFDLAQDPQELCDLAARPEQAALLGSWRQKMIAHLQGRGDSWVRQGDLVVQDKPQKRRPEPADRKS